MSNKNEVLQSLTSSATSRPSTPTLTFKNVYPKNMFITGIMLVPDSYFISYGQCEVVINGKTVFSDSDNDIFEKINEVMLSLDYKILNQGNEIQIFIWNDTNDQEVQLTILCKISENENDVFFPLKTVLKQTVRDEVSDFENIFPHASRSGTYSELLDMKGYKKLIVILSKPVITDLPSMVSHSGVALNSLAYDGNLSTLDGQQSGVAQSPSEVVLQYNTSISRNITVKWQSDHYGVMNSNSGTLYDSPDGVIFTQRATLVISDNHNGWTNHQISFISSQPYFKVIITTSNNGGMVSTIRSTEIYDSNTLGGTGSISFEVKETSGSWVELIPSGEFGTVTDNTSSVIKQVGDVTTISVSGKTYALPSTQNKFRMKYVISGALSNSIDIMRVA